MPGRFVRARRVLDLQVGRDVSHFGGGLRSDFARNDQVPYIDVAATLDPSSGQAAVLMLNRDTAGEREVVLIGRMRRRPRCGATLTGPDLKAFNTFEQPQTVVRTLPTRSPARG
jgi:alpha-L-arabinofuranosidase